MQSKKTTKVCGIYCLVIPKKHLFIHIKLSINLFTKLDYFYLLTAV